jgi:hypothetical protein
VKRDPRYCVKWEGFWLITLALFVAIAKMRKQKIPNVVSCAAALTAVGLLMMLANVS